MTNEYVSLVYWVILAKSLYMQHYSFSSTTFCASLSTSVVTEGIAKQIFPTIAWDVYHAQPASSALFDQKNPKQTQKLFNIAPFLK